MFFKNSDHVYMLAHLTIFIIQFMSEFVSHFPATLFKTTRLFVEHAIDL